MSGFVIAIVIIFRIFLVVTNGQIGPDEALFMLRANQILHCFPHPESHIHGLPSYQGIVADVPTCGTFPLVGLMGRLGLFYGPYPTYWLTLLYWVTQFNFGLLFFINGILFIIPSFLLIKTIENFSQSSVPHRNFLLLFSLTLPISITYSLASLWDTSWLMILASIILYLSSIRMRYSTEFIIGILCGIALGSHLQAFVFVVTYLLWRLLYLKNFRKIMIMLCGIILPLFPYVFGEWQLKHYTNLRFQAQPYIWNRTDIIYLFSSLFRYMGIHPNMIVNTTTTWQKIEVQLAWISQYISVSIFMCLLFFLRKNYKKIFSLHPLFTFFCIYICIHFPLSIYTHSMADVQEGMMFWWVVPFIIPFIITNLCSNRITVYILMIFITIHTSLLSIQYLPRIPYNTGISYSHGPSWWMQEKIVKSICSDIHTPLTSIRFELPHRETHFLSQSLLAITITKHRSCAAHIIFTNTAKTDLIIKPETNNQHLSVSHE